MRQLFVRTAHIIVLLLALVVSLDKFGFQIAPLVAVIGVAGLGIGLAWTARPSADNPPQLRTHAAADLAVSVSHAPDLGRVFAMIHDLTGSNPRVLKDPAPIIGISSMTDTQIKVGLHPG